jgi:anti-sigma B factor antagonist
MNKQGPIRDIRWSDGTAVVEVAGDVDLVHSVAFQQALLELLDRDPQRIVLDLTHVPYMDSSGVASLVKLLSRARRQGVRLTLTELRDRVRSVFEITRLVDVFEICPTEAEALEEHGA